MKELGFKHAGVPAYWPEITVIDEPVDDCERCHGSRSAWITTYRFTQSDGTVIEDGEYMPCPRCNPDFCATCGGKGSVTPAVPITDPAFGKLIPCPANCTAAQRMAGERQSGIVRYSKLPAEYQQLTFETFAALPDAQREGKMAAYMAAWLFATTDGCFVDKAVIAAEFGKEAASDSRNWLVLYGAHGGGKTGLAAAVVHALSAQGKRVRYIRLQDFIEAVQKRYDAKKRAEGFEDEFGDDTSSEVVDTVKESEVLVIDEFDVPGISQNKLDIVERLIRYRHGEKLPTLITTNLDQQGFLNRWEARIFDVIKQRAHWVPVRGVNLRVSSGEWEWE